ncbi:MAG TPA: hypothetical protein VGB78_00370 [Thermoplasmata archaeon]
MVTETTLPILIACASVVAGATYYIMQVRNLVKSRQMDIVMRLYMTWGSEDMKRSFGKVVGLKIKDYESFSKEHGSIASPSRSPIWTDIDRVGWFMNGLGFMVHRKFASLSLIDELFGYGVVSQWKNLGPLVLGWRAELNVPESFGWFEYLAKELEKRKTRG